MAGALSISLRQRADLQAKLRHVHVLLLLLLVCRIGTTTAHYHEAQGRGACSNVDSDGRAMRDDKDEDVFTQTGGYTFCVVVILLCNCGCCCYLSAGSHAACWSMTQFRGWLWLKCFDASSGWMFFLQVLFEFECDDSAGMFKFFVLVGSISNTVVAGYEIMAKAGSRKHHFLLTDCVGHGMVSS